MGALRTSKGSLPGPSNERKLRAVLKNDNLKFLAGRNCNAGHHKVCSTSPRGPWEHHEGFPPDLQNGEVLPYDRHTTGDPGKEISEVDGRQVLSHNYNAIRDVAKPLSTATLRVINRPPTCSPVFSKTVGTNTPVLRVMIWLL